MRSPRSGCWRDRVGRDRPPHRRAGHGPGRWALRVSSLCRGGLLHPPGQARRRASAPGRTNRQANRRGRRSWGRTPSSSSRAGLPSGSRDLAPGPGAWSPMCDSPALVPTAPAAGGAGWASSPCTPMFCAEPLVSCPRWATRLTWPSSSRPRLVGVVVDTYHVWWDTGAGPRRSSAPRGPYRQRSSCATGVDSPLPADTPCSAAGHLGWMA